jgi:hypothetical protein
LTNWVWIFAGEEAIILLHRWYSVFFFLIVK